MAKRKIILTQIIVFFIMLISSSKVIATDLTDSLGGIKFSEKYLQYLQLSADEKKMAYVPRMYDIPKIKMTVTNPLRLARLARSSMPGSNFSLQDFISDNLIIKNQSPTNSCWTFSSLAALETNLALKDYKNNDSITKYDFSERHMEYATASNFKNGRINEKGFNRVIGEGGNYLIYMPYLTNGTGAISEEEMPFEPNENEIEISEIEGKEVIVQVNDIVTFPSYSVTEDLTDIKQDIKNHISKYGGIDAYIHGADLLKSSCYNNKKGALYCEHESPSTEGHAVTIIGWNDNYDKDNFLQGHRPQANGAWIVKNSWGETRNMGDEIINVGNNGFMYVSYEDYNIYTQLTGIEDAQTEIEYENIYQYDEYGACVPTSFKESKIYLATVFDKKTLGDEYLTHVSINASEVYTCKVYVNPNGTSKAIADLDEVKLKAGDTETFGAGYHTIEFLEPVKIEGENFVVVLEIQGAQSNSVSVMMEFNYSAFFGDDGSIGYIYDNVTVESGNCYYALEKKFNANKWYDTATLYSLTGGGHPNFETSIKAFSTSKILKDIEITKVPDKVTYFEGEEFSPKGMIVKANYTNGTSEEITNYKISKTEELELGETTVTISYSGKTDTITVNTIENTVEEISVKTSPTETVYWAGEDFNPAGMVIEAIYKDGTTKTVSDYILIDDKNLKNNQTSITIQYEGISENLAITVKENTVEKIEIENAPTKVNYIVGQKFDRAGMIVKATYANGYTTYIEDYTIPDENNLELEQKSVTVKYEEKMAIQKINVEEKTVKAISIKEMPTKTEYLQSKESLDLTGGIIEISYNDNSKEEISMLAQGIVVTGFDNNKIGEQIITLTYQQKTAQFNVKIKELQKPLNSELNNIQGNVKKVRAYYFSDSNTSEYIILNIELLNLEKALENDKLEYYYYLSQNKAENNIVNWVKMDEMQETENRLEFEINTLDISNFEELSNADTLYLYVKEVATRNGMESEAETSAILLDVKDINIEEYVDGQDSTLSGIIDNTVKQGIIPNAGKNILRICLVIAIFAIGVISIIRYKDIKIK